MRVPHPIWRLSLTAVLSLLTLGASASVAEPVSPALKPRAVAVKHTGRELPGDTSVVRLVVKFHEGSRVRLRGNALAALDSERQPAERALLAARGLRAGQVSADVATVQALLERAPRIGALSRHFEEDEPTLEARKASGEARSGQQLADLNLYYEVPLLPGTTAGRVAEQVAALNALESVEVAYAEPPSEPAMVNFGMDAALRALLAASDISPTTPLYESSQGYLNAAPGGIDAKYAWTVTGGKGLNVKVVDIEGAWRTTHEDMPALFTQLGTQVTDVGWRNHGTAVLGEIVGVANAYGVTGIAPQAQAGVSSVGSQSVASAISSAASAVGRGGVILIEQHSQGPSDGTACTCNTTQCNYIAMEYWQAPFDAIATATANGVIVVEAAGNGSADLDAPAYGGVFNRGVRDSGAILVGASTPLSRIPTCWTNFGNRVDLHGWGEQVTTLGYGDRFASGEDQYYTATFSGTSSASPIVTGAAISLQGVARASGRGLLDSRTVRAFLVTSGTPQGMDTRNIGPLPNLRKALPMVQSFNCPLLYAGQELRRGQYVLPTCPGNPQLINQTDGRVMFYQENKPRWGTSYYFSTGSLIMKADGNLVFYDNAGQRLWSTNTGGNPGAWLGTEGCNLVIRHPDGRQLWASNTRCVTESCGSLQPYDALYPGQEIRSCIGLQNFINQTDGNVVLYNQGTPLWASGTAGRPQGRLIMQSDGNLVLYSLSGQPLWATGTAGHPHASLFVDDDCTTTVHINFTPYWSTNTWCRP
jgi:hypothetical protein